jgi:hypothetical protein
LKKTKWFEETIGIKVESSFRKRAKKNVVVNCVCVFVWKKGRTRTHNSQGNSTHFRRIIHNSLAKKKNRIFNQTD